MKDEIEHDVLGSPVAWVVVLRADGSVASTKLVSTPNFFRLTASMVTVPPYSAPATAHIAADKVQIDSLYASGL